MLKVFLTILILSFSIFTVSAETSTISGSIPGAENQEIRLLTYTELITYTETILDRTTIDSTGFFSLEIDNSEPLYCILDLDYYASGIFVEPGISYKITADTIQEISPYKAFFNKDNFTYKIDSLGNMNLNYLISEFNTSYNNFILENFEAIYRRRNKASIEEFRETTNKNFSYVTNIYFSDYVEYKIASIELAAASFKKPVLFDKYIKDKPLQYTHVEYMQFFNQFFHHYLSSQSKSVTRNDLVTTINYHHNYSALLDTLGKDSLLRNEVIREMVLMKSLVQLYNNPKFSKQNIISILNQLANATAFEEHKIIALSLVKELSKLESGTLAPQFTLPDLDDSLISLSDFQGRPVYLSFLASWSSACLGEYKFMDSLYLKYGNRIEFITVSLDKNPAIINQFVTDKGYDWLFLYNGTQYDLIKSYNIQTFPLFVLISEEGKILQYPAYKPSEVIEESFKKVVE